MNNKKFSKRWFSLAFCSMFALGGCGVNNNSSSSVENSISTSNKESSTISISSNTSTSSSLSNTSSEIPGAKTYYSSAHGLFEENA